MANGNGDRLNQFIEFVTEYSIRTEEQLRRHEERISLLEEVQRDLRQILDRLTGGDSNQQ